MASAGEEDARDVGFPRYVWKTGGMACRGPGWTQVWDRCSRPDPVNAQPDQATCEEEVAMTHSGGHGFKAGGGAGGEIGVLSGFQVWAWAAWFVEVSCCGSGGEGLGLRGAVPSDTLSLSSGTRSWDCVEKLELRKVVGTGLMCSLR